MFRQERCPKEADLKGAELIAPAIKARNYCALATGKRPISIRCAEHHPLKDLPARTRYLRSTLTAYSCRFPIFAIGGGWRSPRPADFCPALHSTAKIGTFLLCWASRLSSSQLPKCGRVGFIGDGRCVAQRIESIDCRWQSLHKNRMGRAGARLSAPPLCRFLWLLSCADTRK